jgi:hypothetical protein
VAETPKVRVCGLSTAGIVGSNPAGAWMFVCCECCVLSGRSLRHADPSSRGVLPTVMCHCVWSWNLNNEAALARVGLLRQRGKGRVVGRGVFERQALPFLFVSDPRVSSAITAQLTTRCLEWKLVQKTKRRQRVICHQAVGVIRLD